MIRPRVVLIEFHFNPASPFCSGEVITYRYFQTVSCGDPSRWSTFLAAMATRLASSGLGAIPGEVVVDENATIDDDLLVALRNLDYGRSLLEECVRSCSISVERPIVPRRWINYRCDEYFADDWWYPEEYDRKNHLWDGIPESHLWNGVFDYTRMYEDPQYAFLAIAGSGCDGVDFGYRQGCEGLWALYRGEDYYKLMAPSIAALRDGWCGGTLSI